MEKQPGRIYTKTGDDGTTSLRYGVCVSKDDPRLEACGSVDELNAAVGVTLATLCGTDLRPDQKTLLSDLQWIQQRLCNMETILLTSPDAVCHASSLPADPKITETDLTFLEKRIDEINADLPPLHDFILPGGGPTAAQLHLCRTICRRAERRCVTLSASHQIPIEILSILNRLSDYFFVAARWTINRSGENETKWQSPDRGA